MLSQPAGMCVECLGSESLSTFAMRLLSLGRVGKCAQARQQDSSKSLFVVYTIGKLYLAKKSYVFFFGIVLIPRKR